MPSLTELLRSEREARASEWAEYRSLIDTLSTREPNGEETQTLDRLDQSLAKRTAEIDRLDRAAGYETQFAGPQREPELRHTDVSDMETRQSFDRYLRSGDSSGLEFRAVQEAGVDVTGGFLVPAQFRTELIEALKSFGGVRPVASTITTASGGPLMWPTADTTSQVGEIVPEGDATTEENIEFGQAKLGSFLYSSKMISASLQLLQDNAFGLEGWLRDKLAQRIARIQNKHWTYGVGGTTEPEGLVPNAPVGVTSASPVTTTGDELIDLVHSLDPLYRANAQFMMPDGMIANVRKLKNIATGDYVWQPGLQAGSPDRILGYNVVINNDMRDPAAAGATPGGEKSVLFGDFGRAYVIRDVRDFTLMRLQERRAEFFQVVFLGFLRSDAVIQDAHAYRALQQHA